MAKKSISLAARNALVYFILFTLGLTISSVLFLSYSSVEIEKLTDKRLKHTQEMIQLKFETYLNQLEDDINQLSYSPLLEKCLVDTGSENLNTLFSEYSSFLKSKYNYFQIRILSTDEKGKEILRVERIDNIIKRCSEDELQYKGNRDYFKELIELPYNDIYYSKIDLNKENGKISEPQISTLRIGKKIKTSTGEQCILIANVDLTQVFNNLKALVPDQHELRLFNKEGHYLIHPEKSKTFTFETASPSFFSSEYDLSLDAISNEGVNYSNENGENIFFNLKYNRSNYMLFGGVSVKDEVVFASFYSWRRKMILISVLVAMSFLILAFVYMRKQAAELRNITEELKLFSSKIKPKKSITQRKDEIGELAKSFEEMSQKVYESHSEMEEAKKKAETADQEKEEFLENMSHEIRNPLQSILGGIQILEQNQNTAYQQPFIESLKFNSQQLNSLVTDVLDFGKLKSGLIRLEKKWHDLEQFCFDLVNASKYRADKKNISIELDYDDSLRSILFRIDQIRLYQILNNLLNNAIKFTPKNGAVRLKVVRLKNGRIHFSVIDNGAGIKESEKERFVQRKIGTNYNSGAGLGLAIVQELLLIHEASLEIKSEEEVGSEFGFNLELEEKVKTIQKNNFDRLSFSQMNETSILVLEDDSELGQWYGHVFREFNVSLFTTLSELEKLELNTFDFIICDLNLESTKLSEKELGTTILPLLKTSGKLFIISGSEIKYIHAKAIALKKPVDKQTLLAALIDHQLGVMYDVPDFSSFEKDYDENNTLIKNALTILIKAWEQDKQNLSAAIENDNQVEFQKIKHRIIASIRRLKLGSFEIFLNELDGSISDKELNLQHLNEKMNFYISKINFYIEDLE